VFVDVFVPEKYALLMRVRGTTAGRPSMFFGFFVFSVVKIFFSGSSR